MKRRIAAAFSALATASVVIVPHSIPAHAASGRGQCASSAPSFSGSFIQPDLVDRWTDAQLRAEMEMLARACIKEQVIQWTADTGTSPATRIYPSSEPQSTKTDVVGRILAAAQRQGIKVFLGLQTNNQWWNRYANDEAWLDAEAAYANKLADDLWQKYGSTYRDTIAGWYLSFEVDNWNFPSTVTWDRMASFYQTVGTHLNQLTTGMPVVISPFYNSSGGLSADGWSQMWRQILSASDIDVIAMQDGVGAGHATTEQLPEWFAATKQAIQDVSPTTQLWADTETFIPSSTGFISMPTAHVVSDMHAVRPYVNRYWSFSYDHYYSPVVVNPAYDKTYRAYLKTGAVESEAPTTPAGFTAIASDPQAVTLRWQASTDRIGVTRYLIYRNGTLVRQLASLDRSSCGKSEGCIEHQLQEPVTYVDSQLNPGETYEYTVVAEDAAGNRSAPTAPASATTAAAPPTPVNLSRGAGYSCSLPADQGYPDPGAKLTDGQLGTVAYIDPAWTGRLTSSPFTCTLDLGRVTTVNEVTSRWLQDPGTGIVLPKNVDVAVSTDGQNFTALGSMAAPSLGDARAVATFRLINLTTGTRFVRLSVNPTGAGWSFTDEVEVRQATS
ncbi:DUF4434 domain-containing protein [Micromonospora sp. NPDC023966]|uniref:DUF4434 domain-containing protein n=1 Tax=Micromonospora sp. NPDC023966 TaxID=3154699 RepID=UPI00340E408A